MNAKELSAAFADNISMLPIAAITIATTNGPQEADALILGDWALNESEAGWAVTHRKSGYAARFYVTPIEALIALGIMLGAGFNPPDTFDSSTFSAIPDIKTIGKRIKAGAAILDSWDLDIDYNEREWEDAV